MSSVLKVENLCVSIDEKLILKGVDLEVRQGEIHARDLEASAVIADGFVAPTARGGGITRLDGREDASLGDCDS